MDALANFARSSIVTAPSPAISGTSVVVEAGQGTYFSAVSFNAVCWPPDVEPSRANAEIVRVTNIATDTFTITRAQEGTTAQPIGVGWQIAQTVTALLFTQVLAALQTLSTQVPASDSLTNSTTNEQQFATTYTVLTGTLVAGKGVRVIAGFEIQPVAASQPTLKLAVKIGSTVWQTPAMALAVGTTPYHAIARIDVLTQAPDTVVAAGALTPNPVTANISDTTSQPISISGNSPHTLGVFATFGNNSNNGASAKLMFLRVEALQ